MNEEFFEWLDNCPTQWFLLSSDEDERRYQFVDNDEVVEDD